MDPKENQSISPPNKLGLQLKSNFFYKLGEILLLFLLAFLLVKLLLPLAGENLLMKQAILWLANIFMLVYVWTGLKLRGESWADFGLTLDALSWKEAGRLFLMSLLVFVIAILGFVFGSILMANITGIPESSDMSNYEYLQNSIPMLLLTLIGVYIVSSFGEEVIYRAFLINRLEQLGLDSKWGRVLAVVISAIIFGLVHWEWGPMGVGQTTFMGLALGFCYLKFKKRLWILVLAHAYMDTILMLQLYMASNS